MTQIKDFVRDAFEVGEIAYQFQIDLEDGLLTEATLEEVSAKYSLSHILGEAHHRLDIAISNFNNDGDDDDDVYENDINQLEAFIEKWSA